MRENSLKEKTQGCSAEEQRDHATKVLLFFVVLYAVSDVGSDILRSNVVTIIALILLRKASENRNV